MQAAVRRGLQPGSLAACYRSTGLPQPWQALRNAFSGMGVGADAIAGQQGAAAPPAAAAAQPPPPPPQHLQQQSSSLAADRAALQVVQQAMQAALGAGNFGEVLRLLRESEQAAAAAAHTAAAGAPGAAAWRPTDRAALYDTALRACALHADAEQAWRLVDSMWKQQVPVGVVAHTALLQALCAAGRHAAALDRLRSIPGKRQRTTMFTLLLRACNDAGATAVGRECYALFQRRGHTPDTQLLAEVVRLHGACGDAAAAEAAWRAALPAAASDAEAAALHAARAAALAKAGDLDAAVAALEEMMDAFAGLLPVDTSRSLREAAEAEAEAAAASSSSDAAGQQERQQRRAWQEQQEQARRAASPVEFMQEARNAVLRVAQRQGDSLMAQRVASLATLRGLPPDVGTYNSLLRVALVNGDGLQAVLDGLQEMRRLGLAPNRETYLLLLRACQGEANTAAAQAAFDAMPADSVPQTRTLHQALLGVYSAAGDLEGVDGVYRRMRAAGFLPDAATFRALLDSIRHWAALDAAGRAASEETSVVALNERAHQRQLAAVLLERWNADLDAAVPAVLSPALFASLLHAYSQSGQVQVVLMLMWQAFGCQLSPDTAAHLGIPSSSSSSSASSSSSQAAAEPAAAAVADGSPSSSQVSARPAAAGPAAAGAAAVEGSTLDALDAALTEDSSRQAASGGSEDAASSELPAARELGSSSSSSAAGWGDVSDAALLSPLRRSTVQRAHLAPSLPIFNAAIGACTRVGHAHMRDAVALLRSMLAAGLSPDVHTYTSLIAGCAYGRQAALARELMRHMQQRGVQPSPWTHNAMLKVECWTYGPDAGMAMLRRLVAQGFQPDRATWSTLLGSAKRAKRGDITDLALAELAAFQQREDEAAAEAARLEEEAAAAEAAAAGLPPPAGDHRWHGYYAQQQEDEDDW